MGRKASISIDDVKASANELESRFGPGAATLRRVREALGRGSLQTIQRHLTSLRSARDVAPIKPLSVHADEISIAARQNGISAGRWIAEAIEEKLQRDRLARLQRDLVSPASWTPPRRRALARLTQEAGTRSQVRPQEEQVSAALLAVGHGQTDHLALARRVIADGHPHDLYLVVRGERNLETLLDRLVERLPGARLAAIRIGMEMRLDGALMNKWLSKKALASAAA